MKNTNSSKTKALVLFSGGLDSRLAVKLLQEQDIDVTAVLFKLPFGGGCCNDELCSFRFSQVQGTNLQIIDCTKGEFLKEYLNLVRHPKFGHGTGINPCIDCRIFLLKEAKKIAKEQGIKIIATGEVLGERPMSQHRRAMEIIEQEAGLKNQVLRPLSAKLLPETDAEKQSLVNREKLLDISGRQRKKQIELAKKYNIQYPTPGGGCILCEKPVAMRIKLLLEKNLINEKTLNLAKIGRHFYTGGCWFVVARNESECLAIETQKKSNILESEKSKPAVYFHEKTQKAIEIAKQLQKAYSKSTEENEKLKEEFEKYKI